MNGRYEHEWRAEVDRPYVGGKRRGFTLTEVMISMLLLGLVMGGFFQVANISRRTRRQAQNHYTAVIIANNRIERAKHIDLADLVMLEEIETQINELGVSDPDGAFLRTTVIEPNYDDDPLLTRVTVMVSPPSTAWGSEARSTEIVSTILTEYLLH